MHWRITFYFYEKQDWPRTGHTRWVFNCYIILDGARRCWLSAFLFSSALNLSVTDAIFESLSGLTTTGATVISGLDDLQSPLFYRQQLQWLGGMGIIVLAISLLPMLGIGGMQLYRAESPGPIKDNKLLPRLAETAKALWYIYLALTVICAIAYGFAGIIFLTP